LIAWNFLAVEDSYSTRMEGAARAIPLASEALRPARTWQTEGVTFEEVYQRFRQPVWRLARRLTGSDEEALDACQEIFLRVWKGLGGFRGEAQLSTWVFQIAWNYLRALRRSHGRRSRVITEVPKGAEDKPLEAVDPAPDPERRAGSTELLARLEPALRTLPEAHRLVLWLRDGEDLSYAEIAAVLDVPIGTVRSRLARARSALKRAVEA
jgi:RNA polymerase sigma-70 factor (ECF subfamily)